MTRQRLSQHFVTLVILLLLGACAAPESKDPASAPAEVKETEVKEKEPQMTVKEACLSARFGDQSKPTLRFLAKHGEGYGIEPLARLSLRNGQTVKEFKLLASACEAAGF